MKSRFLILFLCLLSLPAWAQVDVASRRILAIQAGAAVSQSEERPVAFGYFWYNENHFPLTNTALRVLFAGIWADAELSYFLPANTNTVVGIGASGGIYVSGVTPYERGERLSQQCFYGDTANVRVFINQTVPASFPVNLRATYYVTGNFYRESGSIMNFVLPPDFMTQTLQAEVRLGAMEPGILARRGIQLYLGADANYRSGYSAFGPVGAPFPTHSDYQRAYTAVSGRLPVGPVLVTARLAGGMGRHLDELNAYRLGGHVAVGNDFSYVLHGYYTREIFADDFGLANLTVSIPITKWHELTGHLYGDWAAANMLDVKTGRADEWRNFLGVGAGVSFRAIWETQVLLSYGYGINAVRNGDNGGHEIGLALEKKF